MFIRSIVLAGACSAFAFGCAGGESESESQEIIDNLVEAGYQVDDIRVVDEKVYVGNDAEVSLEASREMIEVEPGEEQYRTNNLVGFLPALICLNDQDFLGNAVLNAGFGLAVENWQQLAGLTGLSFQRVTFGPVPGCTFFIDVFLVNGVGGQAGFPSGGFPFPQILIGVGLVPFGADVVEHVLTHEIGHTIGFRHSDFFNRSISCGGAPVNEENPPSGLGAILIPGTPSGAVVGGSIMNSCFRAVETGEFTGTDIIAVDNLY